jgi:hypothetical protein
MAVHDDISTLANVINIALDASKQNVVQKPNFYSAVSIHWKQHFVVHSVLELRLTLSKVMFICRLFFHLVE